MTETQKKKRILIVDDDVALATLLANKLKIDLFEVGMAADGQSAMERLETEHFDMILLDLNMPWFDGFHVLEELKSKQNNIAVIIISNLSSVTDINRAKALGALDYLVKTSVTPDLIVKEIKKHLD